MIELILFAFLGLLFIAIFILRPKIGLLMYVLSFPFTNLALLPGIGVDKAIGFLALSSWLIHSFCRGKLRVPATKHFVAVLLFVILAVISIQFISVSSQKMNLTLFYISLPLFYLAIFNLTDTEKFLNQLFSMLVLSMGIFVFVSLGLYLAGSQSVVKVGRLGGILYNMPNFLGYYMTGILPLALLSARLKGAVLARWFSRIVFIAGIIAIVLTYSRAAFLGLALIVFLFLIFDKTKQRIVGFVSIGVIIVLIISSPLYIERMSTLGRKEILNTSRGILLYSAINMMRDHPFFGVGVASLRVNFSKYVPLSEIEEKNPWLYRDIQKTGEFQYEFWPHGVYTTVLGETGLVGFGIFLFIVLISVGTMRRLNKMDFRQNTHLMNIHFEISLIAILFMSVFFGGGRDMILWFFLFLPAVLKKISLSDQ